MNIKESNTYAIRDFVLYGNSNRIQGAKLKALIKLIQKNGEPVKVSKGHELEGQKAYEFDKGEFVCIIHIPLVKGQFFPCKLKRYHLQELKTN